MPSDSRPRIQTVIKISGKEIIRNGAEAFIFIHLDGWGNLLPAVSLEARDDLFRAIMNSVWKSLTAGGQQIAHVTTCMEYPEWATGKTIGWKAPVDFVFDCFESKEFEVWSNSCLPLRRPIVVAVVTDNDANRSKMLRRFEDHNLVALHRLDYPDYLGVKEFAQEILSRDPEGTIVTYEEDGHLAQSDSLKIKRGEERWRKFL